MAHFNDEVEVRDDSSNATIKLMANRGAVYAGNHGKSGSVRLLDPDGVELAKIDARTGIALRATAADIDTIQLEGASARLSLGAHGTAGDLRVLDDQAVVMFQVTGSLARMRGGLVLGAQNAPGSIGIMGPMGRPAVYAEGTNAKLSVGNIGNAGDFSILDNEAAPVLEFNGLTATLQLGGEGKPGYLVLRDRNGTEVGRLSGNEAGLFLGCEGKSGEILILDKGGHSSFSVDGGNGIVTAGRGENRVVIDGSEGDIKLSGADCAERFPLRGPGIEPGTVLVVGDGATLGACDTPYDKRVAGVASGAQGVRPGIVLNRDEGNRGEPPMALNGKVFCKVDAGFGAIGVGDLLTTSATRGHAMKAVDPQRAYGAVLGKAMAPLEAGTGLIPVLVSLL
ncbi:MAG: hypothetical protein PVJ49_18190 [Acidobacteriota bacterium]|jgi:hypothetical protein